MYSRVFGRTFDTGSLKGNERLSSPLKGAGRNAGGGASSLVTQSEDGLWTLEPH